MAIGSTMLPDSPIWTLWPSTDTTIWLGRMLSITHHPAAITRASTATDRASTSIRRIHDGGAVAGAGDWPANMGVCSAVKPAPGAR